MSARTGLKWQRYGKPIQGYLLEGIGNRLFRISAHYSGKGIYCWQGWEFLDSEGGWVAIRFAPRLKECKQLLMETILDKDHCEAMKINDSL